MCDYCNVEEENLDYVFRKCLVAKLAWIYCSLNIDSMEKESWSLEKWVRSYILFFNSKDEEGSEHLPTFVVTLWSLWVTRNDRVFKGQWGHLRSVLVRWWTLRGRNEGSERPISDMYLANTSHPTNDEIGKRQALKHIPFFKNRSHFSKKIDFVL